MTSRDFCYWLQGFFEINGNANAELDVHQTIIVRNHLAMVFKHEIDPSHGDAAHQAELSAAHQGQPWLDLLRLDWEKGGLVHGDAAHQDALRKRLKSIFATPGGGSTAPGPKLQDLEEGLARDLKPGADALINC